MASIKEQYYERVNEQTPAGGVYYIVYFRDADGEPCTKSDAVHYEIIEYDKKDHIVARSYS